MFSRSFFFTLPALLMTLISCSRPETVIEAKALASTYAGVEMKLIGSVLSASNTGKDAEGAFHFLLEEGIEPEMYAPMAQAAAEYGWNIYVYGNASTQIFNDKYDSERCVVVGGIGDIGADAFQYGFERRHKGVDGAIMVASLFDEQEVIEFKGKFSTATIVASEDRITPPEKVSEQNRIYPSQTYFLTINGGNHTGFFPGQTFADDGVAGFPPEEQLDTLGKIVHARLDRFCQTRLKRIADEKRKADRGKVQ